MAAKRSSENNNADNKERRKGAEVRTVGAVGVRRFQVAGSDHGFVVGSNSC